MDVVQSALGISFKDAHVSIASGNREVSGNATLAAMDWPGYADTSAEATQAMTRNVITLMPEKTKCASPAPLKSSLKMARIYREGTDGWEPMGSEPEYAGENKSYFWNISLSEINGCIARISLVFTKKE
ncbi:hypothetical protein [Roseateles sp. DXS20W]